jgi:hypothetical protein
MFKLTPNPTFKAPVPLSVPGMEKPLSVPMEFRHKTQAELTAWMAGAPGRSDPDVLGDILVGWEIAGDDGQPLPYSHTHLATLLENYPAAKGEIFNAYLGELTRAKAKN